MIAGGALAIIVGASALATDGDRDGSSTAATTVETTTTATPPTTVASSRPATSTPTSTPTSVPAELEAPSEFVTVFGDAIAAGDVETLLARLHPAVPSHYGEDVCQAYLASLPKDPSTYEVARVGPLAQWTWEVDDAAIPIDDAAEMSLRRTTGGTTTEQVAHFAVVDGEWRWFTHCDGTPMSTEGAT